MGRAICLTLLLLTARLVLADGMKPLDYQTLQKTVARQFIDDFIAHAQSFENPRNFAAFSSFWYTRQAGNAVFGPVAHSLKKLPKMHREGQTLVIEHTQGPPTRIEILDTFDVRLAVNDHHYAHDWSGDGMAQLELLQKFMTPLGQQPRSGASINPIEMLYELMFPRANAILPVVALALVEVLADTAVAGSLLGELGLTAAESASVLRILAEIKDAPKVASFAAKGARFTTGAIQRAYQELLAHPGFIKAAENFEKAPAATRELIAKTFAEDVAKPVGRLAQNERLAALSQHWRDPINWPFSAWDFLKWAGAKSWQGTLAIGGIPLALSANDLAKEKNMSLSSAFICIAWKWQYKDCDLAPKAEAPGLDKVPTLNGGRVVDSWCHVLPTDELNVRTVNLDGKSGTGTIFKVTSTNAIRKAIRFDYLPDGRINPDTLRIYTIRVDDTSTKTPGTGKIEKASKPVCSTDLKVDDLLPSQSSTGATRQEDLPRAMDKKLLARDRAFEQACKTGPETEILSSEQLTTAPPPGKDQAMDRELHWVREMQQSFDTVKRGCNITLQAGAESARSSPTSLIPENPAANAK